MSIFVKTEHTDTINNMIEVYGDNFKAYYAAAEELYFHEHGKLPEWATFIEYVEEINGSLLFVHTDRDKVN